MAKKKAATPPDETGEKHERKVQKPKGKADVEKKVVAKGGKSPERGDKPKQRKASGSRRDDFPKSVLNARPALGYQGKCFLNPDGAPRFGKGT